jgi:hypothetical protein
MGKLYEILGANPVRPKVVASCVRLIDDEVARKRGLLAIPLKAGFKVVKGFRPGFIPKVVDHLLPEFCEALEPLYVTWSETPKADRPTLEAALRKEQNSVAERLLGVTDRRADRSTNRVIIKVYRKLRGRAKNHVMEALPGLGQAIEPHLANGAGVSTQ